MRAKLRHPAKFRWNRWNCGRDRAIFQFFRAAAMSDFWNYKFLTVGRIVSVELPHHANFCGDQSNRWRDISILDFWNLKFLTVGTVKRVELHLRAKFRQNRSNCGWDITIFRFFPDGGRPPSWICNTCVGTIHEGHLVVFITVWNLVGIDAVVLIICTFFDFATLACKRLFTHQNCGVLGFFDPLNGE